MKINWKWTVLLTGAIACSASPVLANAGTPLMRTAFQHLFLGNVLIDLIESFMLSSWFKIPSSVGVITAANYVAFLIEFHSPQPNPFIVHAETTVITATILKIGISIGLIGI